MQQLGRYRILDEIGRGGFATVYRAMDPALGRGVALKVMHPVLLSDPTFHQRFRREARALASLRHPHILVVFEVAEADGRLFIVMELANGPSLAKRIEDEGPVSWKEMLVILKPVCEALEYAHAQDVVHRDLKPSNILLDSQRGSLLSDFGLARIMSTSSTVTSTSGGILGTPSYIAPELWEYESASPQSDIYSLGCIIYEMLTGKLLFSGSTPVQVLRAHDRGPQFPVVWPAGVPEGLTEVLGKALERSPEARYSSPMSLFHALEDLESENQSVKAARAAAEAASQWRELAESSLAEGALGAARMAVGRWLAVQPGDPEALNLRAEIDRRAEAVKPPPAEAKPVEVKKPRKTARKREPVVAETPPVQEKPPETAAQAAPAVESMTAEVPPKTEKQAQPAPSSTVQPPMESPARAAALEAAPVTAGIPAAGMPAAAGAGVGTAGAAAAVIPAAAARAQKRFDAVRVISILAAVLAGIGLLQHGNAYSWWDYSPWLAGAGVGYLGLALPLVVLKTGRVLRGLGGTYSALALGFSLWILGSVHMSYPDIDFLSGLYWIAQPQALLLFLLLFGFRRQPVDAPADSGPSSMNLREIAITALALHISLSFVAVARLNGTYHPEWLVIPSILLLAYHSAIYVLPSPGDSKARVRAYFIASILFLAASWYILIRLNIVPSHDLYYAPLATSLVASVFLLILLATDRSRWSAVQSAEQSASAVRTSTTVQPDGANAAVPVEKPAGAVATPAARPVRTTILRVLIAALALGLAYAWANMSDTYTVGFAQEPATWIPLVLAAAYLLPFSRVRPVLRFLMMAYFLLSALYWTVTFWEPLGWYINESKTIPFLAARVLEVLLFFLLLADKPAKLGAKPAMPSSEAAREKLAGDWQAAVVPEPGRAEKSPVEASTRVPRPAAVPFTASQAGMAAAALVITLTWIHFGNNLDYDPVGIFFLAIVLPPLLLAAFLLQEPFFQRNHTLIRLIFMGVLLLSSVTAFGIFISVPDSDYIFSFLAGRLAEVILFVLLLRELLPPATLPRHG